MICFRSAASVNLVLDLAVSVDVILKVQIGYFQLLFSMTIKLFSCSAARVLICAGK